MTISETLAKIDAGLRPLMTALPPYLFIKIYSSGRKFFLNQLVNEKPGISDFHFEKLKKKLWGIDFGSQVFNAAGMFKNGNGYELACRQGAGAFLAGTVTALKRDGNFKNGILHPFAPYPKTNAASNWMGLPNDGFEVLAKRISEIYKKPFCPVGISIASDPAQSGIEALISLIDELNLFEKASVDFIEINESCPNVPHEQKDKDESGLDKGLIERLEFISNNFISKKSRNLPLIVKYSVDTDLSLIPYLLDLLITLKFDGVNFGNTSTNYDEIELFILPNELKLFKFFTREFGGGISGQPLKNKSLLLCKTASDYLKNKNLNSEFHIVRTGGISSSKDLLESEIAGVSLNQWFTGYFENFAKYGHRLYKELFDNYSKFI